jgi:hypothetical protein
VADERLKQRWRDYVAESTPDNAMAYCRELARSEQAPANANVLGSIGWESNQARDAIYKAAKHHLGAESQDACFEELHWLTECHYWLLGNVSPSCMREIAKAYSAFGMELKQGDEGEARKDHERATPEGGSRAQRTKIRGLEQKVDSLKRKVENLEYNVSHYKRTSERLEAGRAAAFKDAGFRDNYEKLRRENERLAKIIQEANRK